MRTDQLIGAAKVRLEEMKSTLAKISEAKNAIKEKAAEESDYYMLKDAFSPFGIPHMIIRSALPQIEDTANQILRSMTGGRMEIAFRTEKTNSSKKETLELDVLVLEHGKEPLPYLSKSGGEKVKASLATVLAIAETKASSAGMRMGLLAIDEPPFLDSEGTQAYIDALETVQNRYKDIKILAITHDAEFAARFPETIHITKDENGSHIAA